MCSIWLLLIIKKAFQYFIPELEIVYRFIYIRVHFEFQFLSKEIWILNIY